MSVYQLETGATPVAMLSPACDDLTPSVASIRVGAAVCEGAALFSDFSFRSPQRGRGLR